MSELSPDIVESRLGQMAQRSRRYLESAEGIARSREHRREVRRTAVVDMSPHAVDARIRKVAALRRLCLELAQSSSSTR